MSTTAWNPRLHPRDRRGRFADKPDIPGVERWKNGSFLGWDDDVVYIADKPHVRRRAYDPATKTPGRVEVYWKAFHDPDTGFFKMWFPESQGPHHAEMHGKYRDDHPDLDPYEPDEIENSMALGGYGYVTVELQTNVMQKPGLRPVAEIDQWRSITPEIEAAILARVRQNGKAFRDALIMAGYGDYADEVDYEFDPNQPRDHLGRWVRIGARIAPWKEVVTAKSTFPETEVTMENLTDDERAKVISTWEKNTGVKAEQVRRNLGDVFREAEGTPEWEAGEEWYQEAHDWARERAMTHDLPLRTVAGVISALSPMTEWNWNKHQADLMIQYYSRDPEHFTGLLPQQAAHESREWAVERGEKWPLGAGRRNLVNAAQILQGTPVEDVLPQAKTRGFYNSIAEPNNPIDVVVDTHMLNAAYGGLTPGPKGLMIEVTRPGGAKVWGDVVTPEGADFTARKPFGWFGSPKARGRDVGVIPLLADAIRDIADEWNAEHPERPLTPMQVQAIIWTQWLKMHPAQEKRAAVKASQRATEAAALAAGATA